MAINEENKAYCEKYRISKLLNPNADACFHKNPTKQDFDEVFKRHGLHSESEPQELPTKQEILDAVRNAGLEPKDKG